MPYEDAEYPPEWMQSAADGITPQEIEADIPFENPEWWTAPLPAGVAWSRAPRAGRAAPSLRLIADNGVMSEASFIVRFESLLGWLSDYEITAYVYDEMMVSNGGSLPITFLVTEWGARPGDRQASTALLTEVLCGACGATHIDAYHSRCPNSTSAIGRPICENCGWVSHADMRRVNDEYIARSFCTECLGSCELDDCEEVTVSGFSFCSSHAELQEFCGMGDCRRMLEYEDADDFDGVIIDGYHYCASCSVNQCGACGYVYGAEGVTRDEFGRVSCMDCMVHTDAEINDPDDLIDSSELLIATIPGREKIRMCGIEIEGGDGHGTGEDLARQFYSAGLSTMDDMAGYHHGRGGGFVHVERDSSVDWEAVIGPVNMAEPQDVQRLNRTVRMIRSAVHDGELKLDLRCGVHIHIEAAAVGLNGAFNLNTLFGYIEDPFYRLAAARWSMHRAMVNSHYTQPVPKRVRNKVDFGNLIHRAERYHALSFSNYINSMMNQCVCGAVRYDAWEDCTCPSLGKCTFEFRLFNSTTNPTKLHAYLALTQALVAKALSMDPETRGSYEPMEFMPRLFKDMNSTAQEVIVAQWEERLEWMFNELPLTDGEKNSIYYVAKNSELALLGEGRLSKLATRNHQTTIEEVLV